MQEAVGLLDSIAEFCRRANMAESTFGRRAVNDGKFVSRLRDGARITPETLVRVSEFLTTLGVSAPASPRELMPLLRVVPAPVGAGRAAADAERPGAQLPLLRQPAEIPAVREYLQREAHHRQPGGDGAGPPASRPAGRAHLRRRHGRRHGADAGDARDASPAAHPAVLRGGQGDQPGGRAPLARQDGRPLPRASGDRAGGHQHVLHRGAVADAEGALGRHLAGVARGGAGRHHGGRVLRADRGAGAVPRPELAGAAQPEDRQPRVRAAGGAGDLPRRLPLPARRCHPTTGPGARRLRPRDRLAALSRPGPRRVQGLQGHHAPDTGRCAPAGACSASTRAGAIRGWRSCRRSGPRRTRSRPTGTT